MSELFDHIDKLKKTEPRVAVATLVNTRGTTPRKEGAKMVVGEGGRARPDARSSKGRFHAFAIASAPSSSGKRRVRTGAPMMTMCTCAEAPSAARPSARTHTASSRR